jgi:hypothetical protein
MNRITCAALAAIAPLALSAAACGGSNSDTTTGATTTATSTTTETTTTDTTTTPAPPPAAPRKTILIVYRNGTVVGGLNRTTVDKGTKLTVAVRADVSDEVHVHGYDLMQDVAPGKPARITFVASIPGRFEIELENKGLQIADLQVNP